MFATAFLLSLALSASSSSATPESTITAAPSPTKAAVKRQATTYETTSPLPLTEYFYPYSAIPYQVNPYDVGRGPQSGYNICNTTDSASTQCQTGVVNSISDFCFSGAPGLFPNQTISDVEASVVAYCSKAGHGARIFPPGTFTAVQFMKTPAYIQVVGLFNQTGINLDPTDPGGELDPHGADLLGNPLGGLMYSTGFVEGDNKTYVQTQSWNNFVGNGIFCMKLCDPSYSTDLNFCQNIYDIIGCDYNAPAAYAPGVFLSCEGELQDEVGTYTSNGQTFTWSQPSSLPADSTLPWTPRIPASSNCVTYQSSDLFPLSNLGYQATSTTSSVITTATTGSKSGSSSGSASRTGSGSSLASSTSSASASASTTAAKSAAGKEAMIGWELAGMIFAGFVGGAALLL